jgi:hypothetical protein
MYFYDHAQDRWIDSQTKKCGFDGWSFTALPLVCPSLAVFKNDPSNKTNGENQSVSLSRGRTWFLE